MVVLYLFHFVLIFTCKYGDIMSNSAAQFSTLLYYLCKFALNLRKFVLCPLLFPEMFCGAVTFGLLLCSLSFFLSPLQIGQTPEP